MDSEQITETQEGAEATAPPVEGETPNVVEPTLESQKLEEKPLTRAEIQAMIEEKEKHWQSVSEKQRKALSSEAKIYRKRAETAESNSAILNEMAGKDPAMAARIRAAQTQSQANAFRQQEQRELQEQNTRDFYSTLEEGLTEDKIDPKDERIDWGMDAPSPVDALRRFNTSVAKIKKENAKVNETKRGQEFKDLEMRLRKELGLDSADKTASAGAGQTTEEQQLDERYPTMKRRK